MADRADPLVVELAIIRESRGLSQREIARRADISHRSIQRWESGQQSPTLDVLRLYATALRVDLGVVRPGDDITRPSAMDGEALADGLRRLAEEAAARLTEVNRG